MAAHARLKNEITEDKKCHNLMRWLVWTGTNNTYKKWASVRQNQQNDRSALRLAKTQISLGMCPVWTVSSLSARRKIRSLATHWRTAKTLIHPVWSESSLGIQVILLILSWGGSNMCIPQTLSSMHIKAVWRSFGSFVTHREPNDPNAQADLHLHHAHITLEVLLCPSKSLL